MTANSDEFVKIEFTESYNLLRLLHKLHYDIFKLFISIYLAAWGGSLLAYANELFALSNITLFIGLSCSILFSFVLISNRYHYVMQLTRLKFIQDHFIFASNPSLWRLYPKSYKYDLSRDVLLEGSVMMRLLSTFTLTIIIVNLAVAAIFYRIDFSEIYVYVETNKYYIMLLFVGILLTANWFYANARKALLGEDSSNLVYMPAERMI